MRVWRLGQSATDAYRPRPISCWVLQENPLNDCPRLVSSDRFTYQSCALSTNSVELLDGSRRPTWTPVTSWLGMYNLASVLASHWHVRHRL